MLKEGMEESTVNTNQPIEIKTETEIETDTDTETLLMLGISN
jgi:hypothetical protein